MAEPAKTALESPASSRRRPLLRVAAWTGLVVFFIFAAAFIESAIYFHRAQPILRQRVIQTLAARYDSRVELDTFSVSVWHGFEVTGGGLKLYPNQLEVEQPLIAADKFSFRTTWRELVSTPMRIGTVRITGLDIHLPPKNQRSSLPSFHMGSAEPGKIQIVVDHIDIDHASLVLGTNKPGKTPLDFEIANLRLTSSGAGKPLLFHAILVNPKPIGNIDSTGSFGPFNEHSPADTPVSGTYSFTHADLNPLKGIGGILSSTGRYRGVLDNITVDGETDTPDFSLDTAHHPVPLHTTFHAVVDGTNGDTHLLPVDAQLLHSHIIASGDVITVPGQGHDIDLDVVVRPARIQDLLELGVRTQPPPMTGALVLNATLHIPPGHDSITHKMRLQGRFQITGAHFANPSVQAKINELSLRGQGLPEQAKQDTAQGINPNIASDMQGNFLLDNNRATITGLRYTVPGAGIALNGVYSLQTNNIDFHGTARLQAKVSQMVTGWKSLLLKPVDPFFSKNGAGTQVPISITGTRSDLHFGLDFHHGAKARDGHTIPNGNRIP